MKVERVPLEKLKGVGAGWRGREITQGNWQGRHISAHGTHAQSVTNCFIQLLTDNYDKTQLFPIALQ